MLRKQGEGVAQAFHDLVLGEVAGESQVGALKSRAHELGNGEIRAVEKAWLKSASARLAPSSLASVKSAPERSAPARFAPESVAKRSDGPRSRAEARLTGPPFHDAHLPLGGAQGEPDEVGHRGRVLPPPVVPRSWPAAQDFHMFGVGQHSIGRKWRKMAPVFAEGGYLDCVTPP
jgi:hypothetical protein